MTVKCVCKISDMQLRYAYYLSVEQCEMSVVAYSANVIYEHYT